MQHFSLIRLRLSSCTSPPRVDDDGGFRPRASRLPQPEKTPARNRCRNRVSESQSVLQRKSRRARHRRAKRLHHRRANRSSTVHQIACCFERDGESFDRFGSFATPGSAVPVSPLPSHRCTAIDRASTPSSTRHRSGIRSRVSRRSCVPFSDRSSRSSTGRDSPPAGTAGRDRSAARDDLR